MPITIRPDFKQEILIDKLKSITGEPTASGALMQAAEIVVNDVPGIKQQLITITAERNKLYNAITEICNNYKLSIATENKLHSLIIEISNTLNPKS